MEGVQIFDDRFADQCGTRAWIGRQCDGCKAATPSPTPGNETGTAPRVWRGLNSKFWIEK